MSSMRNNAYKYRIYSYSVRSDYKYHSMLYFINVRRQEEIVLFISFIHDMDYIKYMRFKNNLSGESCVA
jgi:hypothetical protein